MTVAPPPPPSGNEPRPGPQRPPPRRRSSNAVLLLLTGTLLALFFGSIALVAWFVGGSGGGSVAEGSFLRVELEGEVPDAPSQGGLYFDPEDVPIILSDVVDGIRDAAADERITGLFLVVDSPTIGFAGTEELRSAIADFRATGKPCVAYAETYTTGSYFLASACDRVVLAPTGVGLVTGLAVTTTYYLGAFQKFGIQADMLHVGDFKSAVEPYTRAEPSEPASLAMNELLDGLWSSWVSGVASGRGRSEEEVQAWVDHPPMSPTRMLEAGLVDALAFPDQVRGHVLQAKDDDWVQKLAEPYDEDDDAVKEHFTDLDDYLRQSSKSAGLFTSSSGKIAIVYTEGPIVSGKADGGLFGEAVIADRTVRRWLADVREDEDVKAVVLRVNSPGGSGLASDMIWRELMRLKASGKPVVVSMGNYAASGGYYIATAGDWVVAEPSTITGSIGVFGGKLTFGGAYAWLGLTEHTYKRGANSDLLSTSTPFTEEGRAVYQGFLDDFYEVFLARVSAARKLDRDAVHAIAQGRVWTGTQAKERGLVDEIGGLDVAIAKAAELGGVGEDRTIERWPKQKTFLELVMEDLESSRAPTLVAPMPEMEEALQRLLVLDRVLEDGTAALLPGDLRVE